MAYALVVWWFTSSIFIVSGIASEEDCQQLAKDIAASFNKDWNRPNTYKCIPYKKAP